MNDLTSNILLGLALGGLGVAGSKVLEGAGPLSDSPGEIDPAFASVARGTEVSVGAFLSTFAQTQSESKSPYIPLVTGLVLSSAGVLGSRTMWGGHVASTGHGALGSYFAQLGTRVGSR